MPAVDINSLVTAAQGTNISTGVTCNAYHGQITTQAMDATAGSENAFIVTNDRVGPGSVIVSHINSTSSAGTPVVSVGTIGAGVFTITITNLHGTNSLNNTAVISFLVLK